MTFTGDGEEGIIRPGEFRDFGLSLGRPEGESGSKLTFKALQTYEGGEVVRWIGGPDSDEPAAQVALTAAEEEHGGSDHSDETEGAEAEELKEATAVQTASAAGGDGPSIALVIAALVVGGLGLVAGGAGLLTARRRTA